MLLTSGNPLSVADIKLVAETQGIRGDTEDWQTRTIRSTRFSRSHGIMMMTIKPCLSCGIVSSLLCVAMNVFVPMQWEGYSSAFQTISELSAVDAPTRPS